MHGSMMEYVDGGHGEIRWVEANTMPQHGVVCATVGIVTLSNPGPEGWAHNSRESIGGCYVAWKQRIVFLGSGNVERTMKPCFNVQTD